MNAQHLSHSILIVLAAGSPLRGQDANEVEGAGSLQRVFPEQIEGLRDPEVWRGRLTDRDLDRREHELDRFLAVARRDPDARALLEDWAADASQPELAWTARLALRELGSDQHAFPLDRFDDPLRTWMGRRGASLSDWASMQRELERMLGALGGARRGPNIWNAPSGIQQESARGIELQIGPDGVHCKVTEKVDGEERTHEYEAESLEALLDVHPELSDQLRIERGNPHDGFDLGPWRGFIPLPAEPTELRTDILGVYVHALSSEERASLNLEEGVGLYVDRTMPGTIAATLGIQRGHVLLSINERALDGREAISEVLCERAADGELRVRVIDSWGREGTRVWRPGKDAAGPLPGALESEDGGKRF